MTELEKQIIETTKANVHQLYYYDQRHLEKILKLPDDTELVGNDKIFVERMGKAFGLIPKTQFEIDVDRRNQMKRHPMRDTLRPRRRHHRRWR